MAVPEALIVAVAATLARRACRYAARRACYEFVKVALWMGGWALFSLLIPVRQRGLWWAVWGIYLTAGAAIGPTGRRARWLCAPGVAFRMAVELLFTALSRSGTELARAAAWLVVAARSSAGLKREKRPRWLRAPLERTALDFLLYSGVARRSDGEIVFPPPGELTRQVPSGDAGAATSSTTDRSPAESPPT